MKNMQAHLHRVNNQAVLSCIPVVPSALWCPRDAPGGLLILPGARSYVNQDDPGTVSLRTADLSCSWQLVEDFRGLRHIYNVAQIEVGLLITIWFKETEKLLLTCKVFFLGKLWYDFLKNGLHFTALLRMNRFVYLGAGGRQPLP